MTTWTAFLLGIIQGVTEFLPISSSGHLVVAQSLFGVHESQLAFDIVVHLGTLLAVVIYFFKELVAVVRDSFRVVFSHKKENGSHFHDELGNENASEEFPYARTGINIILAMIPTVIIAVTFKNRFEALLGNPRAVGFAWIAMGILLVLSQNFLGGVKDLHNMKWWDAIVIGFFQGVAIIPGFSRAGSTILAGMLMGVSQQSAAVFSFLLSIPTILGAALFELKHGLAIADMQPHVLLTGFVTSMAVGYLVIGFLLKMISRGRFHYFGFYCLAVGFLTTFLVSRGIL